MSKTKEGAPSQLQITPKDQLEILINHLVNEAIVNPQFSQRFSLSGTEGRNTILENAAKDKGLNISIIGDYDLPGIEAGDIKSFVEEVYFRFFVQK